MGVKLAELNGRDDVVPDVSWGYCTTGKRPQQSEEDRDLKDLCFFAGAKQTDLPVCLLLCSCLTEVCAIVLFLCVVTTVQPETIASRLCLFSLSLKLEKAHNQYVKVQDHKLSGNRMRVKGTQSLSAMSRCIACLRVATTLEGFYPKSTFSRAGLENWCDNVTVSGVSCRTMLSHVLKLAYENLWISLSDISD